MSGSMQGAGGIGGMLAMSVGAASPQHYYYHADGNGNNTALINASQAVAAKYLYDAFGNLLSQSGPMAAINHYRFSSKEALDNSGLVYYLYRFYDPNLQRWPNSDPIQELGGLNVYEFVANSPIGDGDYYGLAGAPGGFLGGFSGPFRPPPGPWAPVALGAAVGTLAGQLGSDHGNNMMDGCPGKNCKKSDCESCCNKGLAWSAAGDGLGVVAGGVAAGWTGFGLIGAIAGGVYNGYQTYEHYEKCKTGCASKKN